MERIITVTLNPAIDLHLETQNFKKGEDNPAEILSRDSGGKGVNVSRALTVNGCDNLCYMTIGRESLESFTSPLKALGMRLLCDTVEGYARENINIHSEGRETVIATPGPRITSACIETMKEHLLPLIDGNTYLVFAGRISHGVPISCVLDALLAFKEKGARLVVDSKSIGKEELVRLRPYLIKPNESEAEALTGLSIKTMEDARLAAEKLRGTCAENVLVSLGSDGCILCTEEGSFYASAPGVEVKSTVGAGDSTVAGMLSALCEGAPLSSALERAVAFGSAACAEEGTNPPRRETVAKLLEQVKAVKM